MKIPIPKKGYDEAQMLIVLIYIERPLHRLHLCHLCTWHTEILNYSSLNDIASSP